MTDQTARLNQEDRTQGQSKEKSSRISCKLTLDPILIIISVISFATRFYKLDHPRAVVFDELHYIKFITLYAKRIFFFDPQPPLGKQLITLFAHLIGFDGDLSYSQIGDIYKPELPVLGLRLLPCITGSLIAPVCYLLSLELGFRQITAALVSTLIITENSLLTQSRFLLLDPILILLSISSIYCYVRFTKQYSTGWLCSACLLATLAACTKYSGFYTYAQLVGLVGYTWWNRIDQVDLRRLARLSLTYVGCLIIAPILIYIGIYYAHLAWLTKAGPHDSIMTSAFQASLENGLASITRGQPLEIVHGSQITLRHTHGRSCWLHSHEHLYPIKYTDGRGSSHQQQVTCYSFKDVNNWWIIKRPHIDELVVNEPYDKIKDGDLIQLVHGLTGRTLNSHDVASAMSPFSQEVSCYVDHNISMPAQNVWQVRLQNPHDTNNHWHTINSRLQLIHHNSSLALRFSGRQLPDWGFHQHEIIADKELKNEDSIWNVEEHRYTKTEDQREREIQFGQAEFVPLEPTSLTFFEKFYELHYKLLTYQQDTMKDHIYACESPLDWILMSKGTAYWVDNYTGQGNAQIFLIGNISTSSIGLLSMAVYTSILIFYILRRRRQILTDVSSQVWEKIAFNAILLFAGYLTNVVPYFLYESPLFLQNYLSAIVFKILIIGALVDHLDEVSFIKPYITRSLVIFIIGKSVDTFVKLAPLSYGFNMSGDQVEKLRWKDTWQLIVLNS